MNDKEEKRQRGSLIFNIKYGEKEFEADEISSQITQALRIACLYSRSLLKSIRINFKKVVLQTAS